LLESGVTKPSPELRRVLMAYFSCHFEDLFEVLSIQMDDPVIDPNGRSGLGPQGGASRLGGRECGPLATILGGALPRGQHGIYCLLERGDEGGDILAAVELKGRDRSRPRRTRAIRLSLPRQLPEWARPWLEIRPMFGFIPPVGAGLRATAASSLPPPPGWRRNVSTSSRPPPARSNIRSQYERDERENTLSSSYERSTSNLGARRAPGLHWHRLAKDCRTQANPGSKPSGVHTLVDERRCPVRKATHLPGRGRLR
jgi:hypothetical protein